MIPSGLCTHFFPRLRRQCDAGLRAPHDCHQCPAYYDASAYMGVSPEDAERVQSWRDLRERQLPRAHFRVNGVAR